MKINIEIFGDGKKPVTCARDHTDGTKICRFLWTNIQDKNTCNLFQKDVVRRKRKKDGLLYRTGFIIPCKECLEARSPSAMIAYAIKDENGKYINECGYTTHLNLSRFFNSEKDAKECINISCIKNNFTIVKVKIEEIPAEND